MKAQDFSAWLSAISGMSEAQRAEAAALEKAADAGRSTKTRGSRREDALGTADVERVAAQGCPHCAGRGRPIAAFARRAGIPFHAVPSPGKLAPEAPHLHISNVNAYHRRLKQWLGRFNGVATKNLPTTSAGDAPSRPGATRRTGSKAPSAMGHIDR